MQLSSPASPLRFPPTSQPLRVLHVLFSPRMAGSERYCVDLANQQAEQGHEVHVAGLPGSPMARALSPAVRFHGLPLPVLRGLRVRRLMGRIGADLCHAHLSPACKSLKLAPAHVGTVATLHVGYKAHQHGRLDGVICVNQQQLGRLDGYTGRRRVIPNWLPSATAAGTADAAALRARHRAALGIGSGQLLVGAVGRLHPSKGMDVLVAAFLAQAPADAVLAILGEGPQRQALEALAGGDPRVRLLGFRDDVGGMLEAMDLFVSPSREESFGLAIVEAMAAGLPMVATAAEGPSEILRDAPVELVAPGCAAALGAALGRACARLQAGGTRRVRYAMQPFEQRSGVGSIGEFYAQVMQDLRRPPRALGLPARASHV